MHEKTEEKLHHCVLFILERFQQHQQKWIGKERPPFFLGLNGVQGAGKTVLVGTEFLHMLRNMPHRLIPVPVEFSDFKCLSFYMFMICSQVVKYLDRSYMLAVDRRLT